MSKQTPEGRVKDAVKAVLGMVEGTYAFWPVQNGRGKTTLDCLGVRPGDGKAFAVETKRPGERASITEQQKDTARQIMAASGMVFVIDEEDGDDLRRFSAWLAGDDSANLDINIAINALVGTPRRVFEEDVQPEVYTGPPRRKNNVAVLAQARAAAGVKGGRRRPPLSP